ncbi:hypothetical protein ACQP2F_30155 [Actinoplanes sp. CA-030573]
MDTTYYERVGGEPAVTSAVDRLYRVILADDRLAPYLRPSTSDS